ncbi:zinc finger protein 438 [Esox lucius]|uniref:C2H2-type domain-containing protein n=1 Tax=Esox lucius TaxID=8010 RepID=A0A3P8XIC7_ESOLU|nr:zinc finger protein 438 [Esox lucius]XP_010883886.1 zinc finger protein 438 [Esox lucius]XP_028972123.1 zinc finger protein 438 [Esox lucius]XP_034145258.1 zinc finger protein 438 [Esox lucius]
MMKSLQFRSIAPKAPVAVAHSPAPILACKPPSALPESATTAVSPKSILVPAQNYALMQVAGQEGTFSLVALPPSVPPQSPQQQPQQQQQPIQQNLKLPISRYQPMRTKSTPEKVKGMLTAGTARGARTPTKVVGTTRTQRSIAGVKKKLSTLEPKEEPTDPVILIDSSASSEISGLTALLPDKAVLYSASPLEQVAVVDTTTTTAADLRSTPAQGPAPITSMLQNLHYPSGAVTTSSPAKLPPEESGGKAGYRQCQPKPGPTAQPHPHPGSSSITVLSPAIFSKAVQIIPSPPKGKLPILPYSKMKSTLIPAAKLQLNTLSPKKAFPSQPGLPGLTTAYPTDPLSKTPETAEALTQNHVPNSLLQSRPQTKTTGTLSLLGPLQVQKPPGKKRGRKRKTMEDILAFEARKKRSLSFFRRRVPEKPSPSPAISSLGSRQQQGEVDISKKYRSIRPKPHHMLLMETVPQLVSLPSLASSDSLEPELLVGHQLSAKVLQPGPPQSHSQQASPSIHPRGVSSQRVYLGNSRPLHRCPTCSRCFQFKHHLQSHMNSHTNSRPYICPVCRKAYAHSGSLSTHMKLHHSEGRPRRTLRCEFCEKAFGYVGVYFSHLREVHKVILTVEPSISQHEDDVPVEGAMSPDSGDEQAQEEREDPVELQIKCGRCQAITPTFADMKLHLLYVHGEEVQVRLRDGGAGGAPRGGREAEDELVKHAAHYWRQLNEKRNLVRCGSCDEEFFSFSKLKRHILSHHQGGAEDDGGVEGDPTGHLSRGGRGVLGHDSAFNCVLCSQVMDSKEEVMEHWRGHHNCEDTHVLWEALSSYSGEREIDIDSPPSQSPH